MEFLWSRKNRWPLMLLIFFLGVIFIDQTDRNLSTPPEIAPETEIDSSASATEADRGIWRANNATAVISAIDLGAGALAIVLLLLTFQETRKAANAADRTAKAAENAERAHLYVESKAEFEEDSDGEYYLVSMKIVNYGKSPAQIVSSRIRLQFTDGQSIEEQDIMHVLMPDFPKIDVVDISKPDSVLTLEGSKTTPLELAAKLPTTPYVVRVFAPVGSERFNRYFPDESWSHKWPVGMLASIEYQDIFGIKRTESKLTFKFDLDPAFSADFVDDNHFAIENDRRAILNPSVFWRIASDYGRITITTKRNEASVG